MRPSEILRIIACIVVGVLLVFPGQMWLYSSQLISLGDISGSGVETWVQGPYSTAAAIVFGVCIACTIGWSVMAAGASAQQSQTIQNWRVLWGLLYGVVIFGVLIASSPLLHNREWGPASMALLFAFDTIVLFWLPTATSSPGATRYVPLGSFTIRQLFD